MRSCLWLSLLPVALLAACGGRPPVHEEPPPEPGPLRTGPPETRVAKELALPDPEQPTEPILQTLRLASGMEVALHIDPDRPMTSAALSLTPSPLASPPWHATLACLGLIAGGTTRLPGRAYQDELERIGARLEARWRLGCLLLRLDAAPDAVEQGLALLLELLLFPAYSEEALENGWTSAPSLLEGRPSWASLAGDGPPPIEDLPWRPEELPSASRMQSWHRAAFHPGASRLAVLGPLSPEPLLKVLARTLAHWEGDGPPVAGRAIPAEPGLYWTEAEETSDATLTVLIPLGPPWVESWPARRVLARLLTGLGARGPLPRTFQQAGLLQDPLDIRWIPWPDGAWALAVSVPELEPTQLAPALEALAAGLRGAVSASPDPVELAAARSGAVCEERLVLRDPETALEQALLLAEWSASQTRDPGPVGAPLKALGQVGPQLLAGAARRLQPAQVLVHIEAPASLRARPEFTDARVLAPPAGLLAREAPPSAPPTPEEEQRGRELLALAIQALGGEDALNRLETLRLSGTIRWELGPEGSEEWKIEPDRFWRARTMLGIRVETLLEQDAQGYSTHGEERQPLPPDAEAMLARDLGGNILWVLARFIETDGPVAVIGEEEWEGVTLERVRLGHPGPDAILLAVDPQSGLPRVLHHPGSGRQRDILLDYRDGKPLRHPHRIERWRRGERLWVLRVEAVRLGL